MFFFYFYLGSSQPFFHFHMNFRIKFSTDTKKVLKFVLYIWISMDWIYIFTILSLTVLDYGIFLLLFTSTLTFLTNALYLHIFLLDLFHQNYYLGLTIIGFVLNFFYFIFLFWKIKCSWLCVIIMYLEILLSSFFDK